ncbi:MAG: hypothetical protein ABWZ79_12040 [Pedobacter agri]
MQLFEVRFNKDLVIPYTAVAFLLGYVMAALSSWFEGIYYFTWGGKPSTRLLEGKNIWKIKFYAADKVKNLLKEECSSRNPSMDELFSCAVRKTTGGNNTKIEDFNAHYAFSRSLLTTAVFGVPFVLYQHSCDYRFYLILLPLLFHLAKSQTKSIFLCKRSIK